ncbi:MAG: biopolymer transporter ExbD [Lentisphaeria bacterium]|nr:biopolymer transporter ExbD [Lentisphaeria bacterium]
MVLKHKAEFIKRIRPRLKPIHGAPDLLPFVNVFFLLLIFMTVSSSFTSISGIPVNLPETPDVENYRVKKNILTLDKQGNIYLNDTQVHLDHLKEHLAQIIGNQQDQKTIVLRVDTANSFETVSKIMAMTTELRINVFLLTRRSDSGQANDFTEKDR